MGITRGQDEVILTHARSRTRFGDRIRPEVSRFVDDIPEEVLDHVALHPKTRPKSTEQLSLF